MSLWVAALAVFGLAGVLVLTSPWTWSLTHPARDVADAGPANVANGHAMFLAGDCATCHVTPGQTDPLLLGGGKKLSTGFGTFSMPNISPDPQHGIGDWTLTQFTRAMREGVGPGGPLPDGRNLYPAFPYTSYQRMSANDLRDLFTYIKTLKPVPTSAPPSELKFPFNIRRGVGVWRLAFLDGKPATGADAPPLRVAASSNDPMVPVAILSSPKQILDRGAYLVEGPGHCAECHSPRGAIGNVPAKTRFSGGPEVGGLGYYPNITPDATGIGYWSVNDIANYLLTGISPINQPAGGDMAEIIENTSKLSPADRIAMAVYLKSLPPIDHPAPGVPEPNRTAKVVSFPRSNAAKVKMPASVPEDLASAATANVVSTKAIVIDQKDASATDTLPDGKLIGGTALKIVGHSGDLVQVELHGWQSAGAEAAVYALAGQRITEAVLGAKSIAALKKGKTVVDPDTGQQWTEVTLTAWTTTDGMLVDRPAMWSFASQLFSTSCSACHTPPKSDAYLANQWTGTMTTMRRYTSLSDDQFRLVLAYLQNHSRDVTSGGVAK